ncbi:Bug family tripartite tricarboxylate transporter substrate binding protein [Bordetella bronchialis]|uniref:Twin-arginine translocation pathway signal n=1 Tax=Bordetella bronchialis TaxID=463025 RepID=A0ABN4R2R5_9BORD|nr:tripartite tricarboxylate transporter substrate binding protein [Bordetella bronchialis]ANN67559.1 Twin-arginine translocation pathway signal [Bordetella bronchialis]
MKKRDFLSCSLGALALALAPVPGLAQGQAFPPFKTATIVVGFAAGGASDAAARIIAKKLSDDLGISVVVENKPGAGGNIAHQYTAHQAPTDGSTILLGSVGPLAIAPHFMALQYDPVKDLAPITMGVNFPNVLVIHSGLPIKTFAEFMAYAKANPGKIDFASTGHGSASHMAGELLIDMAKVDIVHIPYKGGAPAFQDLMGGRVAAYFSTLATAQPGIDAGKLVPLATTGLKRMAALPDLPTIAETYPGYNATNWYAFVASSKVPAPILDAWNAALVKVLKSPDVVAALEKHGLPPAPGTRQELADEIARESAMWGRVIRDRNIKPS